MSKLLDSAVPPWAHREATLADLAHGERVPPERLKLAGLTEADFDRHLDHLGTSRCRATQAESAIVAALQQNLGHGAMAHDLGSDSLAANFQPHAAEASTDVGAEQARIDHSAMPKPEVSNSWLWAAGVAVLLALAGATVQLLQAGGVSILERPPIASKPGR